VSALGPDPVARLGPRRSSRERIKVLALVDVLPRGGGAERMLVGLATHLPRDRFEVVVATTRPTQGQLLDAVLDAGLRHVALERRHKLDPVGLGRLSDLLRREAFDVVHAHKFGSNVWGTLFGRLAGVPVVIAHEHSWSYEGRPVRRIVDGQFIGRFADAFVAVSTRDRDRMMEIEGVPPEKIVVMPNAYMPRPTVDVGDVRDELALAPDVPLVGTAAGFRPVKAVHVLVEAFAILAPALPAARLVLAGGGPEEPRLRALVHDRGIAERVHFLGYRQDMTGFLRSIDVAALSSDSEGQPLLMLECMANGTPLVATDVGGIRDVLEPGRSVSLVPRRDPPALAAAIEALLRDPARRAEMACEAAERLPMYRIDRVAAEFGALYERLLERSARRAVAA
jgi:glycosyltransferase involved in cell wall biosynthesis